MPAADVVGRDFAATAPDKLWTSEAGHYLRGNRCEGFLYLAFVVDAYSRRLVGWAMERHLRTELVVNALGMAIWRRDLSPGLIHHSDQGVQYTSLSFGKRLEEMGIVPSMGRAGSALDNAISESFVATLKAELGLGSYKPPSRAAARTLIFEYHSSLGYMSPVEFEEGRMREASAA